MKTYKTSQVAKIVGVHPNTVRLYEQWALIPAATREDNGYRIFTEFHIEVFKLARIAFEIELLQSGLRKKIIAAIKETANKRFDKALVLMEEYQLQLQKEERNAQDAIEIISILLSGKHDNRTLLLKRGEAATYLEISVDTLRNWELNGLLTIKRSKNGYRVYTREDINKLKIIRCLRCANYSLESILRLLNALPNAIPKDIDLKHILNTPKSDEDIIAVCDNLLISLEAAQNNALLIQNKILDLKTKY